MLDRIAHSWAAWPILFFLTFLTAAPGVFLLPSIDRDESRFAQASKEMLEEEDYIRIQYQETLRNKKPAGIHWMQASATAALSDDYTQIWSYRVPSWLGASLAVLATFWAGIALVGRRAAFVGALLFGAGVLLTTEAHISKTDGQLVFWTTLAIGVLARFYLGKTHDKPRQLAMLFWFAIGVNSLIKGPVGPMVVAFAGFGVWILDWRAKRETGQWKGLFWWPGPLLAAMMFVPWFIWIQVATRGEFVKGAVGKDLYDKFFTFSEGHWGIPGYHLGFMPLMFLPATLFVAPAIIMAWRHWRGKDSYGGTDVKAIRFLVCWVGLTWIFFELLLTKLSHYILPAYPGLALLCGWAAVEIIDRGGFKISRWVSLGVFFVGGLVWLGIGTPWAINVAAAEAAGDFRSAAAEVVLDSWTLNQGLAVFLLLPAMLFCATLIAGALKKTQISILLAVGFMFCLGGFVRTITLPSLGWLQSTEMVRQSLASICALPEGLTPSPKCIEADGYKQPAMVNIFGYAEPSIPLSLGTQNQHSPNVQMTPPERLPAVYVFNLEEDVGAQGFAYFETLTGYCQTRSPSHYAMNYADGSPTHFIAIRFDDIEACTEN